VEAVEPWDLFLWPRNSVGESLRNKELLIPPPPFLKAGRSLPCSQVFALRTPCIRSLLYKLIVAQLLQIFLACLKAKAEQEPAFA